MHDGIPKKKQRGDNLSNLTNEERDDNLRRQLLVAICHKKLSKLNGVGKRWKTCFYLGYAVWDWIFFSYGPHLNPTSEPTTFDDRTLPRSKYALKIAR